MTLGRRLAPPMSGPIHTRSNQRNSGRIHQMNQALELAGKTLSACATDETWDNWPKCSKTAQKSFSPSRPDALCPHGKGCCGWGRGSPDAGQWTRLQAQGITNVVESDAMGELRVDQRHHMTPRTEGAGSFIHFCFTGNLGHQKLRNEVANLPQKISFDGAGTVGFLFIPAVWQG